MTLCASVESDSVEELKRNLFDAIGVKIERTAYSVNVVWHRRRYCGRRFVTGEPKVLYEYPTEWSDEQVYEALDVSKVALLCGYRCAMLF